MDRDALGVTLVSIMGCRISLFKNAGALSFLCLLAVTAAEAQQADPSDPAVLLERLRTAKEAKEAQGIAKQLQALWMQSGSPAMDLLLKRGHEAIEVQNLDEAIGHLTALTDHAPRFPEGWFARAKAHFMKEQYGRAMADLERGLALNPDHFEGILGLAIILGKFGLDERSYQALQHAGTIHPHHEAISDAMERMRLKREGEAL